MTGHLIQALKDIQYFKRHFGESGPLVRSGSKSLNEEVGKCTAGFD